ncbi:hypothetical protein E2C01_008224 [Portunus trituberculatus]|uniref:Uncharacterized protein n=1 Tax=Portunus trituberculatus TaxID=210409 RepID=A0A5B7D070_PORTR|nr:hypothetical protein [Portunus trituberculatus]
MTVHKRVNGIKKIDKDDLVLVTEEAGRTRGHVKKITDETMCEGYWKTQFSS